MGWEGSASGSRRDYVTRFRGGRAVDGGSAHAGTRVQHTLILRDKTRLGKILLTLLAVALLGPTRAARAQRVTGPTDDATVLPRGMVRVTVSPTWHRYHERFADGLGRVPKGEVEPLAADFDLDSLGPGAFRGLASVQTGLQSILGNSGPLPITAGRLRTRFDASVATTPLVAEFGLTNRITLGVMVPLVKTRNEVSVTPNPAGTGATVGINPALTNAQARALNASVVSQLNAAAAQLQQRLQDCTGSSDPGCAAINADRAAAQQLVTSAGAAAAGIESVYGVSVDRPGSLFAPVHRSSVQGSVETRLTALSNDFASFLGAPGGGAAWITSQPVGAPPMAWSDFQNAVHDSAGGIAGDTLRSVEVNTVGDVEVGAKVLLFDSFGSAPPQRATLGGVRLRLSVAAFYRFGTGQIESAGNFADIGTGDAQDDIEGRVFADVLLGKRFWASFVARYGVQQADVQFFRVPDAPHQPFPPASRQIAVNRDLGDYMSAEVTPRFVLTDNIAFSGTWALFSKQEDTYALGASSVVDPDSVAAVNPGVLALGTARRAQRLLGSITYSNLAAYHDNRARVPMEVSLTVGRTIAGEDNAPKASITALTFRFYNRIFGK